MRWGIQDNAIYNHSTEDMCLQELDQCCHRSVATNCAVGFSSLSSKKRRLLLDFTESSLWESNATCTNQSERFRNSHKHSE